VSPRRVVYSAVIGGYEVPRPVDWSPGGAIDYVLFTDRADLEVEGWRTVPIPVRFPDDRVRSARHLKVVGAPVLDAYDETMWIDNRVVLKDGFAALFALLEGADMVVPRHSHRATVGDEYREVLAAGIDDPARVRRLYGLAGAAGILDSEVLWTGILLRRNTPDVAAAMRRWMDYILLASRRDQLSVNLALVESGITVKVLPIDNIESVHHRWLPHQEVGRSTGSQTWRPERRPVWLRFADLVRRYRVGRGVLRKLAGRGVDLSGLPRDRSTRPASTRR